MPSGVLLGQTFARNAPIPFVFPRLLSHRHLRIYALLCLVRAWVPPGTHEEGLQGQRTTRSPNAHAYSTLYALEKQASLDVVYLRLDDIFSGFSGRVLLWVT